MRTDQLPKLPGTLKQGDQRNLEWAALFREQGWSDVLFPPLPPWPQRILNRITRFMKG